MEQIKKISWDILVNIIANVIPVIILQFMVQPLIARKIGVEANGTFVTMLAVIHFVVATTSGALCSSRLLLHSKLNKKGDYNIYLCMCVCVNIVVTIVAGLFYSVAYSWLDILLIALLSGIWLIKDYLLVDFRINLDFKNILINNIFLSIGFLLGLCIFYKILVDWYVVFLCGYLLALVHALFSTKLIYEPIEKTIFFSDIAKTIWPIACANVLGMLAVNFDRLFLYPLVGGTLVSIYYSASIMGKIMSLISVPISNVLLSYIVRINTISARKLNMLYLFVMLCGGIFYIICLIISPIFLRLLYPDWATSSIKLVPITSGIAVFEMIVAIMNPIIMRFCKINYQLKIQGIYLISYIILGTSLCYYDGLNGFAFAVLIASVIKVIYVYIVSKKGVRIQLVN